MPIQHVYTQTAADGGNTALVRPSDWNSSHIQAWTLSGNTSGNSTVSGTEIVLQGGSNITLSGSSNSIIFLGSGANSDVFGISNVSVPVGTSGVVSNTGIQMLFAGGSNITLSQSITSQSGTLTISGATLPNAVTQSVFEPYPLYSFSTANFSTLGQNSLYFVPFDVPQNVTISSLVLLASMNVGSGLTNSEQVGITVNVALYTRNATATQSINTIYTSQVTGQVSFRSNVSFGGTWNGSGTSSNGIVLSSVYTGMKIIAIPCVMSLTPGEYWLGYMNSTSSVGSAAPLSMSILLATMSLNSMQYMATNLVYKQRPNGRYTVSTGAFADSVSFGQMNPTTNQSTIYFNLQNYSAT